MRPIRPSASRLRRFAALVAATIGAVAVVPATGRAAEAIRVPLTAAAWSLRHDRHDIATDFEPLAPANDVTFTSDAAHPLGIASLERGGLLLRDFFFENGTIAFDVDPRGGLPGIGFRTRGSDGEEELYLRPESCPGPECMQYAPIVHHFFEWELFPEYQVAAPIRAGAWNHVELVVNGRRMNVYVNHASRPALVVRRLEADATVGAIVLRGSARFTNLTIAPGAVDGLPPTPLPDPTASDPRYVRNWQLMAPVAFATSGSPRPSDVPSARTWQPFAAERKGMLNITRAYGNTDGYNTAFAWLRTTIRSSRAQTKHVRVALTGEVWIFVNGKLAYADANLWDYPARRKPPGRFSLENGSFELPLRAGPNAVLVATRNNFATEDVREAWALALHLDDVGGVTLAP